MPFCVHVILDRDLITLNSYSSVTHVTVEEKSNFKCITSVKLAFLSFNLPSIIPF